MQKKKALNRRDFLRLSGLGVASLFAGGLLSACSPDEIVAPTAAAGATPLPPVAPSDEALDLDLVMRAVPGEVQIFSGQPTRVWHYEGEVLRGPAEALQPISNSYLGPIIRVKNGWRIRVHFQNGINEETIIHWHGLHVPEVADGHPRFVIGPGETYVYDFTVDDRPGTYWYHPHPHGRTGPQVYYGLAGLFLIEDDEGTPLPTGEYDIPLVLQDRTFDADNQFVYQTGAMMSQMMGFLGNRMLVNGQPDFTLPVATRPYRLRILNGSNSRIYKLGWSDGSPMTVIGTTGGLLEKPIVKEYVTLAPAQRVDLWVDFSGRAVGDSVQLVNLPSAAPDGGAVFPIATVQVEREESAALQLPERLSSITWQDPAQAVNRDNPREFVLAMTGGRGWTLNGRTFEMTAVASDERVRLGDLEIWQFTNTIGGGMGMGGGMALPHPMHVHGLQFQILEREISSAGRAAWETLKDGYVDEGWMDTVLVMPGERVKILLKFEDFEGLYLYHCHNLEHEDMGMMRNYRVEAG